MPDWREQLEAAKKILKNRQQPGPTTPRATLSPPPSASSSGAVRREDLRSPNVPLTVNPKPANPQTKFVAGPDVPRLHKAADQGHSSATNAGSPTSLLAPSRRGSATEKRSPLPEMPHEGALVVNVGIDYGTSTTKICVREMRGDVEGIPVHAFSSAPRAIATLIPSLVVLDGGGKFYFGDEAAKRRASTGTLSFDHLKVCLVCEAEKSRLPLKGCGAAPVGESICAGRFIIRRGANRVPIAASGLVALYLAWVMGLTRDSMPRDLVTPRGNASIYNIGVPVDQLDMESDVRSIYRRATFTAWRLSRGVHQGLALDQALEWLDACSGLEIPAPEESRVQLCTEAGAAIVGLVRAPKTKDGIYGLVDIGAWTTDVSFLNFHRSLAEPVVFYGSGTHRSGVMDIDQRTLTALGELWNIRQPGQMLEPQAALALIRTERETSKFGAATWTLNSNLKRYPAAEALDFPRACVAERILEAFHKTAKIAKEKDPRERSWKGFSIYVIGGGAREVRVWKDIASLTPAAGAIKRLPVSGNIKNLSADLEDRFSVAGGLAIPLALWPSTVMASQVDPLPRPSRRELPDSEALGYSEK